MANPAVLHEQDFSSGGLEPYTGTLTNTPTVGNLLVVFVTYSSTVPTVSDNQGNTYTPQAAQANADVGGIRVFTCPVNTSSGSFTLTFNSDTSSSGASVYELSNANTATIIDGTPGTFSATGFGTGSFSISLGTAANAGSLALVGMTASGGQTTTWTAPLVASVDMGGFEVIGVGTVGATGAFSGAATFSPTISLAVVGLMILPAGPSFSVQPTSQDIPPGQTASFSVTASGAGTVTYQWYKHGSSITGATSSTYTTPVLLSTDNTAYFYCIATDSNGTSQSNSAFVTITTPLFITDPTAIIMPLITAAAGAMVGSSTIQLTDSGTLKGAGTLSGSSSVHLTTSGVLKENIVGSSTIHLTTSGLTTGKGALVGSSSIHLTTSGTLKENIVGTTTIHLTDSGTLKGAGVLAGSSSIHFTPSGTLKENIVGSSAVIIATSTSTLTGKGTLAGTSTIHITDTGTLKGAGKLTGASTATLTDTGTLHGLVAAVGSTSITLTDTATLKGSGRLTGTSTATLTDTATIHASGSLSATAQIHITETGTLKGSGAASGTTTVHFAGSATGIAKAALVGSSTIHFTASLAANGVVAIHGSSAIAFAGSATIQARGSLTGTSTESMTATGTVVGHGRLNGSIPIAVNETGTMRGTAACVSSSAITIASLATLHGIIRCVGSSTIVVTTAGSASAKLAASGTTSIHLSASATGQLIGALRGSSAIVFTSSLRNTNADSNFVFVVSEETVVITTTIPTIDLSNISVHAEATYVVPAVTPDPIDLDFVTVITEKNAAQ